MYDNKEGLGMKDYHRKVFQEGSGAVNEKIGILYRDESIYSNTKLESADHNPDLIFSQEGVYDNPAQLTTGVWNFGDHVTSHDLIDEQGQEGIYDNKAGVLPNKQPSNRLSKRAPSFDDPTYSSLSKPPIVEQPAGELPMRFTHSVVTVTNS